MTNGIQPLGYLQGAEPVTPASARGNAMTSPDSAPAEPASAQGVMTPNPSLRIDPALGILIIEFHDETGKVSSTIPTAVQIDAYRRTSGQTVKTATSPLTGAEAGTTETGAIGRTVTNAASTASASPSGNNPSPATAPVIV
jgi:hypothetical protein